MSKGTRLFFNKKTETVQEEKIVSHLPVKVEETQEVTVQEIHETFFTEVNRLLVDAKIRVEPEVQNPVLLDRAARLRQLGFLNTKETKLASKEEGEIQQKQIENTQKQQLQEAIEYFSVKYPQYKFITEESVKKICGKYGLIYGEVKYYIGTVPEKNIKAIEEFKVDDEDKVWKVIVSSSTPSLDFNLNGLMSIAQSWGPSSRLTEVSLTVAKMIDSGLPSTSCLSFKVAAPAEDFATDKMQIENFELKEIPKAPDPVVFQPVMFKEKKYYLIVTAWGDEAEDELVVNEKMN